jgi:hypothetical protein
VNPAACTSTTTSFSAACGYGKSVNANPPTPAARSLTVTARMKPSLTIDEQTHHRR